MGGLLSYFWGYSSAGGPEDDLVDPGTGLSGREKRAVRNSWELVKADYKASGIALFMMFFKAHPEYQKHFKSFRDVPLEKLPDNPRLHAHAAAVLYAITSFVDNLDDIECLKEMLLKLGKNHYPRGILIKQFENLAVVVLDFMQERFGNKLEPSALEGWKKVFAAVNSIVGMGLEQGAKGDN